MHWGYAHLRRYSLCGHGRSQGHRVTKVLETVRRYFHRRELASLVTLTAWSLKSRLLRSSALRVHPRRELVCSHSAPFTPHPRRLPKPGRRQLRKSKIDFSIAGRSQYRLGRAEPIHPFSNLVMLTEQLDLQHALHGSHCMCTIRKLWAPIQTRRLRLTEFVLRPSLATRKQTPPAPGGLAARVSLGGFPALVLLLDAALLGLVQPLCD